MGMSLKPSMYLALAALLLTSVLPTSAAAKNQIPLHGSIQGAEVNTVQGTTLLVDGSGTGIATHLGRFSVTWEVTVNLLNGSAIGSLHLIAANGDSLFTEFLGQSNPTETPGITHIVEINTITGGTGRFTGAAGSFTLERLLDMTTGVTSGAFDGIITSVGAAH